MSPEGSASASDLTVEQYAGISAAIAEGYPLDAVLANEGLAPKAWPGEDTAWKQKLVAEPAAFESYRVKLGEAEDWLGRKVTPLDEDLSAWMGFLGAYGAHQAPFDLLSGLGLGMGDLGRLQRRWQKRLATDEALAKQAAELAKQKPRAVPSVSAAKGALRPFPWSKKGAPSKVSAPERIAEATGTEEDFDLASHTALVAELAFAPKDRLRVLRRHGLDQPALAALQARWDARIVADAALAQDYRRLVQHHRARFESAARSGKDLPRVEARAPVAAFAAHPDLIAPMAPIAAETPSIVAVAAPARAPSKLAGTSLAVDVPRGPALPFDPSAAPSPAIAIASTPPRAPAGLGGTSLLVDVPRGAALPFAKSDPRGKKAEITAEPAPPAAAATPRKKQLGELKFGMEIPKNLPPPRSAYAPPLTLEQHASLAVELAMSPETTTETLARYHLSPGAPAELDAHYREKKAGSAEIHAAWDRAYHSYSAWLAANRRSAR